MLFGGSVLNYYGVRPDSTSVRDDNGAENFGTWKDDHIVFDSRIITTYLTDSDLVVDRNSGTALGAFTDNNAVWAVWKLQPWTYRRFSRNLGATNGPNNNQI